jgi:prepilin-type N-terminal cleavage/methylation domain-containing protein
MKLSSANKKSGFTFSELLIVVAIIGIMATVSLVVLRDQSARGRDTRRKADLEQIRTALEFHRERFGQYPTTRGRGTQWGNNAAFGWLGECASYDDANVAATGFIPGLAPDFIAALPRDPRHEVANQCIADQACYVYRSNGRDYKLLAHCAHETDIATDDIYYDPCHPTWALQISSSQTVRGVEDGDGDPTNCGGW